MSHQNAKTSLSLLTSFCADYCQELSNRPATREAVLVQMREAARNVDAALTAAEAAANVTPANADSRA